MAIPTILFVGLASPASADDTKPDPVAGKKNYKRCAACHYLDKTRKRTGPTMRRIVGRKTGSVPEFRYSKSLKEAGEKA